MVLWNETANPLCRAIERRWKRNAVYYYYYYNSYHQTALSKAHTSATVSFPQRFD